MRGKRALVTGAASGIGLALAEELRARGAEVTLADIDARVHEVAARLGGRGVVLDVRDEAAVEALAAELELDLLCANAGVAAVGPLWDTPAEDARWVFEVNVLGNHNLVRSFVPRMIARGEGTLLFTASIAGLIATPGGGIYAASKHAVIGLAETLRIELAGTGVRVTTLCPGFVPTGLHGATRYRSEAMAKLIGGSPHPFAPSPRAVAKKAIDAALAGRRQVIVGVEGAIVHLQRLAPSLYSEVASLLTRRLGWFADTES